jgi:hypothetical protein
MVTETAGQTRVSSLPLKKEETTPLLLSFCPSQRQQKEVFRIRCFSPLYPGSGVFRPLDPGSRIRIWDPGWEKIRIRDEHSESYSERLETIFVLNA